MKKALERIGNSAGGSLGRWVLCGVAVLCIAGLGGCASSPPVPVPVTDRLPKTVVPETDDLILKPDDHIELRFLYWPELNVTQPIPKDGKISVGEVGYIQASGLTRTELQQVLVEKYKTILVDPVIDVILRSRAPRYIYVGGQVMRPGVVTLMPMLSVGSVFQSNSGNILHGEKVTLSQAILTMGGYDDATAFKENVVVIRYVEGKRYAAVYDMSKDLSAEMAESVLLEPDDIVYVPRTRISEINIWVDQHINQLLPKRLWSTYSGHPVSGGIGE
jgi:protein involved in polysaccharide export with SLBB domain